MSAGRAAIAALLVALGGCASTVPPLPEDFSYPAADARARAESIRESVVALAGRGFAAGRASAVLRRARELGLGDLVRTEWIDWWSLERNVLIELPGPDPTIVYVTAHHDRTDLNPLTVVSNLLNGLPDPLIAWTFFSTGALDNASGVAVALELARTIRAAGWKRTYRILITGSEEAGLRGARAHAARIPAREWERIAFLVNVDSVGAAGSQNSVLRNASDPALLLEAMSAAKRAGAPLVEGVLPAGALTDDRAFARTGFWSDLGLGIQVSLVGGLLPQRSWFTGRHGTRVVSFAAHPLVDPWDYIGALLFLPLGRLHGPRDSGRGVNPARVYEAFAAILEMLRDLDGRPPAPVRGS